MEKKIPLMNKEMLPTWVVLGLVVLLALNYPLMDIQAQPSPDQQASEQYQSYYETYRPETPQIAISVSSPQNNSATDKTSISLTFNVSAPKVLSIPQPAQVQSIQITNVSYTCDWQTENHQLYAYDSLNASSKGERFDFLAFNTTLSNIPEGAHKIQIIALVIVNIKAAMFGFTCNYSSNTSIILNVNSPQPTSPNQNTDLPPNNLAPVILAFIVISVIVALTIFVIRKHQFRCETGSRQ